MIYLCFSSCHVHLYADDTVIYYSDKNVNVVESVLNTELQALDKWMSHNKLLVAYDSLDRKYASPHDVCYQNVTLLTFKRY